MKLILNKDELKIDNKYKTYSGSINYYEVEVEYDESWEGLTKEAIMISSEEEKGKAISVINNKIYIDCNTMGVYSIGFVGYTIQDNEKIYQISTNLKKIDFNLGAGEIETQEQPVPTPSEWEVYIAQIQSMINGLEAQIPTKYSQLTNDNYTVQDRYYVHTDNNFTNTYKSDVENNTIDRHTHSNKSLLDSLTANDINNWNNKQDELVSGTNIKTINNESILGSGNISISGGGTGTSNYNDLTNKPSINNVVLSGNKSLSSLGIINFSGNYNDLTNKPDLSKYATTTSLGSEITARENADTNLQNQIDALTVSSDVIDVVGTYTDLQNYSTTHVKANDIIKVLQDSTHGDAMSYYRWVITNNVGAWVYVGSEGPYYTKAESDILLNAKQNEITSSNKLASDLVDDTGQTNLFVTSTEKTTWSGKQDKIPVETSSLTTITIDPNKYYTFGEVASLTITLATPTDNTVYNEYMFEFDSGTTPTSLTLPNTVSWVETPTIEASKTYQVSIVNNIALIVGV